MGAGLVCIDSNRSTPGATLKHPSTNFGDPSFDQEMLRKINLLDDKAEKQS